MSVRVFISSKLPENLKERLSGKVELFDVPLIKTKYLDFNPLILDAFHPDFVVFTSKNGVKSFLSRVSSGKLREYSIVSVGKSTSKLLKSYGLESTYPEKFSANGLISMFEGKSLAGKRFLIVRPKVANENFIEFLRKNGAVVEEVISYETISDFSLSEEVLNFFKKGVDFAAFTSPSNLKTFLRIVPREYIKETKLIPIGTTTERALIEGGLPVYKLPEEFSLEGIVTLIEKELKFP